MTDDAPTATAKHLSSARDLTMQSVTIARPADELYAYFRDFSNLPSFMDNVVRIDVLDADTRTGW